MGLIMLCILCYVHNNFGSNILRQWLITTYFDHSMIAVVSIAIVITTITWFKIGWHVRLVGI